MIVALLVLGLVVTSTTRVLIGSSKSVSFTQARITATLVAAAVLHEAENLGYATVAEGIDCTSGGATASCDQSDPNSKLSYGGSTNPCWYFGTAATSHYLVPTIHEDASNDAPVIPDVSTVSRNGTTFTIATYPFFDTSQYPSMTCSGLNSGSSADVPLTVLVYVTWGNGANYFTTSTVLYSLPALVLPSNNCPSGSPGTGAHLESLLAFQSTVAPKTTTAVAGGTASILFLDEAPSLNAPVFCVLDQNGVTSDIPVSYQSVTYYGSSSSLPFLNNVTAVDANGASGPNAADPPTGGTYCKSTYVPPTSFPGPSTNPPSSCNEEVLLTFNVPGTNPNDSSATVLSISIESWDHELDADAYTWTVVP